MELRFLNYPLIRIKYTMKHPVKESSGHIHICRPLIGLLHLVNDLLITHYLRVQPQRNFKEVG
ncbi:hypothetical protein FQZ97_796930 [compost metagenome]